MTEVEIIISGHSMNTDKKFRLPKNTNVRFHADYNETCFVPYDVPSVFLAYNERHSPLKQVYSKTVWNYEVHFTNQSFVGIYEVRNGYLHHLPFEDTVASLKSICSFLRKEYPKVKLNIYCMFCRGDEREKIGDIKSGETFNMNNNNAMNAAFFNEIDFNTNTTMSNTNAYSNVNKADPFGFGFDFEENSSPKHTNRGKRFMTLKRKLGQGGKRKSRQSKNSHRRKTRKHKISRGRKNQANG